MNPPKRRKFKRPTAPSPAKQPVAKPIHQAQSISPNPKRPQYVAGILEQTDNQFLIVRTTADQDAVGAWLFPRGPVNPNESPEEAVRRIALDHLGMTVEIISGQPPLLATIDGQEIEVRFFFLTIVDEPSGPCIYAESRWVAKAQLRDYTFDAVTQPVIDWLVTE
ncbi:MAG: NUDIX domain-containing protein [Planctomycetota bacterium]